MNVKVTGKAMIFANEVEGRNGTFTKYMSSIGKKNDDGSYSNASIEVRFKKDEVPAFTDREHPDRVKIEIEDGFLTFREFKRSDGSKGKAFYIMVMAYHYQDEAPAPAYDFDDDDLGDLPF